MRIPPSLLLGLGRFLLFILLEAACIYMVSHNGIAQRYRLVGKLREVQGFFWEKYAAITEYSSLKQINGQLAQENALLMHQLYSKENDTTQSPAQKQPFSVPKLYAIPPVLRTTT